MRLAKYLASCGLGSRRYCENLISLGKILVNELIVDSPAINIDPEKDTVKFRGEIIKPQKTVYYILNKPTGYVTSRDDPHTKKLITDLVPKIPPVWPVGRLDKETSGLLILTNDGDLTQKLTHPKYVKEKEYLIKTNRPLSGDDITKIMNGVTLEDGLIKPDKFSRVATKTYNIVIHEGRNRLIRRLIAHFDLEVISLERIRISNIKLGKLPLGEYRVLDANKIKKY